MKKVFLKELRHRVAICRQEDVFVDGRPCLRRQDIRWVSARIKPIGTTGAVWAASGRNADDNPTHEITIRAMPDLELTRTAWFYESRLQSADRWYRVLQAQDSADARWWVFKVMIDTRTDELPPEQPETECRPTSLARPTKIKP